MPCHINVDRTNIFEYIQYIHLQTFDWIHFHFGQLKESSTETWNLVLAIQILISVDHYL